MKHLILTLSLAILMVGCGSDSGKKAKTTTGNRNHSGGTGGYNCDYRNCNPSYPDDGNTGGGGYYQGSTPASIGESQFSPSGVLQLSYESDGSGAVDAWGRMEIDSTYGFSNCSLEPGTYDIDTRNYGQAAGIAHHYNNIEIEGHRSSKSFRALITNAYANENTQGQWVQDVQMKIHTINGQDCSFMTNLYPIRFGMPIAN